MLFCRFCRLLELLVPTIRSFSNSSFVRTYVFFFLSLSSPTTTTPPPPTTTTQPLYEDATSETQRRFLAESIVDSCYDGPGDAGFFYQKNNGHNRWIPLHYDDAVALTHRLLTEQSPTGVIASPRPTASEGKRKFQEDGLQQQQQQVSVGRKALSYDMSVCSFVGTYD